MSHKKIISIYLDDMKERWDNFNPKNKDEWVWVKSFDEFVEVYNNYNHIQTVSLDHDLGEGEKTGYDVMCFIEKQWIETDFEKLPYKGIIFHTANPVGRRRMELVKRSIDRHMASTL